MTDSQGFVIVLGLIAIALWVWFDKRSNGGPYD